MPRNEDYTEYIKEEFGPIVGRTIVGVRQLTPEELDDFGWDVRYGSVPIVVLLDQDMAIVPSQDPEGNGPGHLFIEHTQRV